MVDYKCTMSLEKILCQHIRGCHCAYGGSQAGFNFCLRVIPVHGMHYRVHVVSIESGLSMLDGGYLSIPTPTKGQWSPCCITSVEKVIAVELKPSGQYNLGITIMSWNNKGPKVVSDSVLLLLCPALGI